MRAPLGHDPPHLPAPCVAEGGIGPHDALVFLRPLQIAPFALEQPGDFEADGGVGQGVEARVGVFEGEGVGVGEVGGDEEVELRGQGEEGWGAGAGGGVFGAVSGGRFWKGVSRQLHGWL